MQQDARQIVLLGKLAITDNLSRPCQESAARVTAEAGLEGFSEGEETPEYRGMSLAGEPRGRMHAKGG